MVYFHVGIVERKRWTCPNVAHQHISASAVVIQSTSAIESTLFARPSDICLRNISRMMFGPTFLAVVVSFLSFCKAVLVPNPDVNAAGPIEERMLFNPVRPGPCGEHCDFHLCNFNGTRFEIPLASFVLFGAPESTSLPYVCNRMENVGLVLESGEATVSIDDKFVPISQWRTTGLKTEFKSNFIRTFKVPFLPHSGIGPVQSTVNEWSFLHDQCMTLPIQRYQSIDLDTGRPIKLVEKTGANDCVAFRTTAPAIHIELTWDTQDDLDLEITEPDGDVLYHKNTKTEYGKLNQDNNAGFCGTPLLFGRENAVYFPDPNIEAGEYKVRVIHFKKCGNRPTNWFMTIVINGAVRVKKSEYSAAGERKEVGGATFSWP